MDCAGDRLGLLYSQKHSLPGTNQEKLRAVFRLALENCRRLEEEPALGGGLRFRGNDAALVINDRLLAPNTEEIFQDVRPEIEFFARSLFRGENFVLDRDKDPRKRFNVSIRTRAFFDAQELLKNLEIR
jgi:hypothetical protein